MSNSIYDPPAYAVSRLRYYDGEFLKEVDFIAEQNYHVDHRNRHQRLLHVAGIAEGLGVTVNTPSKVTIGQGTALDDQGHIILLNADTPFDLPGGASGVMYLEIAFKEVETGGTDPNDMINSATRFTQAPEITLSAVRTPGAVLLATLGIVPNTSISKDVSACAYSGLRLPGPSATALFLQARSDGNGAELSCGLRVSGELQVSGGNLDIGYNNPGVQRLLTVNGSVGIGTQAPQQALVVNSGKVGIGYNDAAQTAGLAVNGNVGIGTTTPSQALVVATGKVGIGYNDAAQTAGLAVSNNVGIGTATPNQALVVASGRVGFGYNDAAQTAGLAVGSNVGIGTTTPSQALVVATGKVGIGYNDAAQTALLAVNGKVGIGNNDPAQTALLHVLGNVGIGISTPAQALVVSSGKVGIGYNDPAQSARLAVSGNVGLGISTPAQALVVSGGKASIGYNDAAQTAALAVNGSVGIGTLDPGSYKLFVYGSAKFWNNLDMPSGTTLRQMINLWDTQCGIGVQNWTTYFRTFGNFAFYKGGVHSDTQFDPGSGGTTLMVITDAGKVGIGTVTPAQALVVNTGNVGIGFNNGIQTARLAVNGKVGIGTTETGTYELCVYGSAQILNKMDMPPGANRQMINLWDTQCGIGVQAATTYFRTFGNFAFYKGGVHSDAQFNPGAGGMALMVIADTGNVGIGTTTPAQAFVVNTGNAAIGYNSGSQTAKLAINGNVGIGTMTPRSALDTDIGVMTGAANDYLKAQSQLCGGGTISWNGGNNQRLSWSNRFIVNSVPYKTCPQGNILFHQPVGQIPANQVHDNINRDCTGGVLLNPLEALWAAHSVGGANTAITWYITKSTSDFTPPSNWFLIATVGDSWVLKLGTGAMLSNGTKKYDETLPYVTAANSLATDLKIISGAVTAPLPPVGQLVSGPGWYAYHQGTGNFSINFQGVSAFSAVPAVVCTPMVNDTTARIVVVSWSTSGGVVITSNTIGLSDMPFSFIAIGPR